MTVKLYSEYYKTINYNHETCSALTSAYNYDCECDATVWSVNLTIDEMTYSLFEIFNCKLFFKYEG
jgi:hypothetical protein